MTDYFVELDIRQRLPVFCDAVFRLLFAQGAGSPFLISFLNAVLHRRPGARIQHLTFLPREVQRQRVFDKEGVMDLVARDETGRFFDIEMQVAMQSFYPERALYYAASLFQGQLLYGKGFETLKPVIGIHVVLFRLWPDAVSRCPHTAFELQEQDAHFRLTDALNLHFLDLTRLSSLPEVLEATRSAGKPLDMEAAWMYFIRYGHLLTLEDAQLLLPPEVLAAIRRLQMLSQSRELDISYFCWERALRDRITYGPTMKAAGRLEGLAEGRAEGRGQALLILEELLRSGVMTETRFQEKCRTLLQPSPLLVASA